MFQSTSDSSRYYPSPLELSILVPNIIQYFKFPERSNEREEIIKRTSDSLQIINSRWKSFRNVRLWFNNNRKEYTSNSNNIFINANLAQPQQTNVQQQVNQSQPFINQFQQISQPQQQQQQQVLQAFQPPQKTSLTVSHNHTAQSYQSNMSIQNLSYQAFINHINQTSKTTASQIPDFKNCHNSQNLFKLNTDSPSSNHDFKDLVNQALKANKDRAQFQSINIQLVPNPNSYVDLTSTQTPKQLIEKFMNLDGTKMESVDGLALYIHDISLSFNCRYISKKTGPSRSKQEFICPFSNTEHKCEAFVNFYYDDWTQTLYLDSMNNDHSHMIGLVYL